VLTETRTVEVPVPVKRVPPADLAVDMTYATPELLPVCQGDYGITREGVETLIDSFREMRLRLARWRAWAQ